VEHSLWTPVPVESLIDLRSDICATPTDAMWDAMRSADIGWATYGEDANVNELERRGADLLGKEAAVLAPTCSMANLAALMALTKPGDRVLVDADHHIEANEGDWLRRIARLDAGKPADFVSSIHPRAAPAPRTDAPASAGLQSTLKILMSMVCSVRGNVRPRARATPAAAG
jgi:hypothetical protein